MLMDSKISYLITTYLVAGAGITTKQPFLGTIDSYWTCLEACSTAAEGKGGRL